MVSEAAVDGYDPNQYTGHGEACANGIRSSAYTITKLVCALASLLLTPALAASGPAAGTSLTLPENIDASRPYLFYLHGAWIEEHGLSAAHPDYGRYEYGEITRALSDRGFVVISEARLHRVDPAAYAQLVARQVTALLEKGVPPAHITVIGHSKGAGMVLLLASMLENPAIQYVVMAGCQKLGTPARQDYEVFLRTRAPSLQGRILSLYDRSDQLMATCGEAFARASPARLESREMVLETGRGHGLFYTPDPVWIDPIVAWSVR